MKRRALVSCVALVCAACEQKPASKTDTTSPAAATAPVVDSGRVVTPLGFGPVRIGATAAQLATALGESAAPKKGEGAGCRYVRSSVLPAGVSVMLVNDTVARIDVDSAGVTTAEGAGVGDTEARITQLYGTTLTVQPHKYTGQTGHYLVVASAGDTLARIIFETDGHRILRYRVGRRPAVEYVERCG